MVSLRCHFRSLALLSQLKGGVLVSVQLDFHCSYKLQVCDIVVAAQSAFGLTNIEYWLGQVRSG